jgi:hypothetical protein
MTANQRRPGFRLPWSSEMEDQGGEAASGGEEQPMTPTPTGGEAATVDASSEGAAPEAPAGPDPEPAAEMEAPAVAGGGEIAPAADAAAAADTQAAASATPPTDEFMRDLVAAMRGVADEARDTGVADVRTRADDRVSSLEADAETRRQELRDKTEQDVAKIGEWEQSEHDRIKQEAEQRVVARRSQLDRQLEADTSRTDAESKAIRDRVAEYERELDAYHAQLIEINDPAAFAAAAKRMPKAPDLETTTPAAPAAESPAAESPAAESPAVETAAPAPPPAVADDQAPVEPVAQATNGVPEPEAAPEADPAAEEALAARLAQLDATLPPAEATSPAPAATAAPTASADPATTEVVVKGLGSFGAITGFRQALSGVEGIDAVALSLGQTGEFVFRASHAAGFDVRDAIAKLEGEGAKIEDRPEGGLRVTLERAR